MSDLISTAARPAPLARFGPVALLMTAVVAAIAVLRPWLTGGVFDAMSTDDAMRLVEVRDLMAGQNWFDLSQHRLDPPGASMHWSRVTDVPLAALMLSLRPLLGSHGAEAATLLIWPLALFGAALALVATLARCMVPAAAPGVVSIAAVALAALAVPALIHFRPGAIDHHNSQIVLLLACLLMASQIERSSIKATLAGAAAALSLAIGLEMLPAIAMIGAAVCGLLVWRGAAVARQASAFAAALALTSVLLALVLLPPGMRGAAVCDAFGGPSLLLVAGGGASLLAIAAIDRWRPTRLARLATASACSGAWAVVFARLYPDCLASPYAQVDPLLAAVWLDQVAETMSLSTMWQLAPQKLPGFYGFPIFALFVAIAAMRRSRPADRFPWVLAIATLIALIAVSLWQVRGAAAATMLAAPVFAAGITVVWPALRGPRLLLVALALSPASFGGLGLLGRPIIDAVLRPPMTMVDPDAGAACQTVSSVASLARLAPGRVMAPIDLGPAILAATDHAVFAAPYHRNNNGNLAMLRLMLAPLPEAQHMLHDRRVDYIVLCPAAPEQVDFVRLAPDGLAARLGRGDAAGFLEAMPVDGGGLKVWQVRKPAS